jgi:hypothetical protein
VKKAARGECFKETTDINLIIVIVFSPGQSSCLRVESSGLIESEERGSIYLRNIGITSDDGNILQSEISQSEILQR